MNIGSSVLIIGNWIDEFFDLFTPEIKQFLWFSKILLEPEVILNCHENEKLES